VQGGLAAGSGSCGVVLPQGAADDAAGAPQLDAVDQHDGAVDQVEQAEQQGQ
jgi:hypothetical protein